jgi:hypothetical protein
VFTDSLIGVLRFDTPPPFIAGYRSKTTAPPEPFNKEIYPAASPFDIRISVM